MARMQWKVGEARGKGMKEWRQEQQPKQQHLKLARGLQRRCQGLPLQT